MRSSARLVRPQAIAAIFTALSLLPLAGCETPPSGIPTAHSVAGTGVGSGTLTFEGRTYSFTLIGSLIGLGALNTLQASGEVYKLKDVSQFSGAYIQGTGSLAVTTTATGELWLENRNGVIIRLTARQAGLTFSTGRYEIFVELTR
jgi:hypothetical protein